MRYGAPAIGPAIDALVAAGCRRILVAPLYPQYCAATTATVVDAVADHLKTLRWQPALRFLPPYHDDPAYLDALKTSVESGLAALDRSEEHTSELQSLMRISYDVFCLKITQRQTRQRQILLY